MLTRKTSIAFIVIIALVTVTTLLLGSFGFVNYTSERDRLWKNLHDELKVNADQMADGLALPIWNFDRPQIDKIVDSMTQDRTIHGVVIRLEGATNIFMARIKDRRGKIQAVDNILPGPGLLVEERNITVSSGVIGRLSLFAATQYVEEDLNKILGASIGSILALDLILTLSLYLLIRRWVLKPLQQIEAYALSVSSGKQADAGVPARPFHGELENLRTSMEQMIGQLGARYQELQEQSRRHHESEERFHTLIEKAPVAMAVGRHGLNIYNNKMFLDMFGYDNADELRGQPLIEQWAPELREELAERARRRELGLPVPNEYEAIGQRKDGSRFALQVAVSTVQLADGPASIGFFIDITERKQAQERVQRSREQLRALSSRLQTLREEERIRISREIHDHLGQLLTALKLDLRLLERKISNLDETDLRAAVNSRIASAQKLTDETILSVQKIASELRPGVLDRLGLAAAIEVEAEAFQTRTGLVCDWRVPKDSLAIPQDHATAMFRIFQEILTNIARHSRATHVMARLACKDETLILEVTDDGVGILQDDLENSKSLGILGMQERASILHGSVTFAGKTGKGTTVTVRIPFENIDLPTQ